MLPPIPQSWLPVIGLETTKPYFHALAQFVDDQQRQHTVYPAHENIFQALELTPFDLVRVVILGQDPYHGTGQAHGLAFSVQPGVRPPPSLGNIFKELKDDLDIDVPKNEGSLVHWARQGVLLLNTVLTVRQGEANSHRNLGWEKFTDAIIRKLGERERPLVFLLWGGPARKKSVLIDPGRHHILSSPHPSPLSAGAGFFGSRPFSQINALLRDMNEPEIDWRLAPR